MAYLDAWILILRLRHRIFDNGEANTLRHLPGKYGPYIRSLWALSETGVLLIYNFNQRNTNIRFFRQRLEPSNANLYMRSVY